MSGSCFQQSTQFPADSLFGAMNDPAPGELEGLSGGRGVRGAEPPGSKRGSLVTRTSAAQARKDRALDHHNREALAEWRAEALAFIESYLASHETCFPPDLWTEGLPQPPGASQRAVGAVIQAAIRKGWMVATGEYRKSPSSNLSPKAVYASNLYRPLAPTGTDR